MPPFGPSTKTAVNPKRAAANRKAGAAKGKALTPSAGSEADETSKVSVIYALIKSLNVYLTSICYRLMILKWLPRRPATLVLRNQQMVRFEFLRLLTSR